MSSVIFLRGVKNLLGSRAFLVVFASLLVISLSIQYVASEPRPQQHFLSLSTLGSGMMAENYYPGGNSTVSVGDNLNWYVSVYNRMGSPEYLSIRMKLLNSTETAPDNTSHGPSLEKQIFEVKHLLGGNSTWVVPIDWSVTEVIRVQHYVVINSLRANDVDVHDLDIRSIEGKNFRIIFELWRYDIETGDFVFTGSSEVDRSVWNQIWFSVK